MDTGARAQSVNASSLQSSTQIPEDVQFLALRQQLAVMFYV
ncbi:hypothetical protein EMIT0P12_10473 [Pseudomonas sp. IT-P12]